MARNRLVVGAALAAALTAACRRAPEPTPSPALPAGDVKLSAPAPTAGGLGAQTTGYTNEMQAQNLRDQAAALGISKLARPSDQGSETDEARPPITYEEGLARTREYSREFEAQRHALEKDKPKSVTLPGVTPAILPGHKEGAPVDPAPDETPSKNP